MKHPNIRIARLKEMIALEEKRAALQTHIETVNERLAIIQNELYGNGAGRNYTNQEPRAVQPGGRKASLRKGRGELKGQILEMLNTAGKTGVTVRELADRIGIKAANIHSWFSMNLKKMQGLKKVGAARYAFSGAVAVAPKPAKKAKAKKAPKKKEKAKAAKGAKKGKVVKSQRGELKKQILGALKSAGPSGMTIKDLAAKLKANYKNVYIWFVTTGKKVAGIKKVGPAHYKLEAV